MDVEAAVRQVVEVSGLELVEVSLGREHGRRVLRVTVDRDGGVDLDAVASVSERISRRLDVVGYDPGPYDLEVSSPGVERPLRDPRDFARRVGDRVEMRTTEPVDGARSLTGTIVAADGREVRIATETGERSVRYEAIVSARTVVDWDAELRQGRARKRRET